MPKPQQRSTEDLAKHKQSMSARKTMFQQKKKENKAKGPKAATAHEKAEAEASAPIKKKQDIIVMKNNNTNVQYKVVPFKGS